MKQSKQPPKVIILEDVIRQIEEQAKDDSKEFFGFLVGKIKNEKQGKGRPRKSKESRLVIEGVAFSPYVASYDFAVIMGFIGTHSGNFAGTVHTHPGSGEIRPSSADKDTFSKFSVNIIANKAGLKVFDSLSRQIDVKISSKKPSKTEGSEIEKIQSEIINDALKIQEDEESGRKQKIKNYIMTGLKILFVVFVISSLVMWYFI